MPSEEENEERGERPTHPLLLFFVLVAVPLGGIGYAFLAYHLAIPISTRLHDFVLSGLKLLWDTPAGMVLGTALFSGLFALLGFPGVLMNYPSWGQVNTACRSLGRRLMLQ